MVLPRNVSHKKRASLAGIQAEIRINQGKPMVLIPSCQRHPGIGVSVFRGLEVVPAGAINPQSVAGRGRLCLKSSKGHFE